MQLFFMSACYTRGTRRMTGINDILVEGAQVVLVLVWNIKHWKCILPIKTKSSGDKIMSKRKVTMTQF